MTRGELDIRRAGDPRNATVTTVVTALRADPAWTVDEVTLEGAIVVIERLHRLSSAGDTLRPVARPPGPDPAGGRLETWPARELTP